MNYRIIVNIIGFLIFLTGIFMMLGLPFSFYYQSDDVFAILISSILTSSIGLLTWVFTKNSERKDVGKREGYLIRCV